MGKRTQDTLTEYVDNKVDTLVDDHLSSYRKQYLSRHPEIRERYRITENINNLRRHGYTVIPPQTESDQAEVVCNG